MSMSSVIYYWLTYVNSTGFGRSLGDLKYKQMKDVPPEAQMITGSPDVTATAITSEGIHITVSTHLIINCI